MIKTIQFEPVVKEDIVSGLSPEQLFAYKSFREGKNLFITGAGGTGKTRLIHTIVKDLKQRKIKYQVCALTGCASLLMHCNARTIHSWSGIRLARGEPSTIINNILKSKYLCATWRRIQVLIVDEVSMLSSKIFELLETIARETRKQYHKPFGGIQIIMTGDFFQLPPVGDKDDGKLCFQSPLWFQVFPKANHIELKTMFRQKDPAYIHILNEIRHGKISDESFDILSEAVSKKYDPALHNGCIPTKLFPVRNKTDALNREMFEQLMSEEYEFHEDILTDGLCYPDTKQPIPLDILTRCRKLSGEDTHREIQNLKKNIPTPEIVSLKVGAVVMCIVNLDMDAGICNGSQGVITSIVENGFDTFPIVRFENGVSCQVLRHYWCSEDYPTISIGQIPLCLAWAMTIHKTQGATIRIAEMDLGNSVFEYGQIYVALSRVQSLDGLYLHSLQRDKIIANPIVLNFYKEVFGE